MLFRVFHSERGRRLAKKIVDFLLEDEGCAECFPCNLIEELNDKNSKEHQCLIEKGSS